MEDFISHIARTMNLESNKKEKVIVRAELQNTLEDRLNWSLNHYNLLASWRSPSISTVRTVMEVTQD